MRECMTSWSCHLGKALTSPNYKDLYQSECTRIILKYFKYFFFFHFDLILFRNRLGRRNRVVKSRIDT